MLAPCLPGVLSPKSQLNGPETPDRASLAEALKVTRSPGPGVVVLACMLSEGDPRSRITLPHAFSARLASAAVQPCPVAGLTNWLTWLASVAVPSTASGSGSGTDWSAAEAQRYTGPSPSLLRLKVQSKEFVFGSPGEVNRGTLTWLQLGS